MASPEIGLQNNEAIILSKKAEIAFNGVNKNSSLKRFADEKKVMNEESTNENTAPEPKSSFERIDDVVKSAMEEATQKAREAAPKVKESLGDILKDVAYGLAYGTSFASSFANEFVPDSVKESVAKGSTDGSKAAAEASGRVKEAVERRSKHPDKAGDGPIEALQSPAN